jgi:hypothetical protein
MRKILVSEMQILATESKDSYLQQMEEMHDRRARKLHGKELNIHIKEMHAHMRGI